MKIKEIKAKSCMTKSKLTDYVINPYTGCQHACVYCLDGETLIIMQDCSSKLLKDLKVGDKIYGVRKDKYTGYYYYEATEVLAIWKSLKSTIRITTDNGIEVICSPEHRWFTTRGWKYSIGTMAGNLRRPYLTKNSSIHGIGKLIRVPRESSLYMRGYLSGMIRGDGLLKSYDYSGKRRNKDIQYQFRLALKDKEAVIRTHNYLERFGIVTNWFKFDIKNGLKIDAIRINNEKSYKEIKELVEFNFNKEYLRGFIAGIFDAEGHGGSGDSVIRISNSDKSILKFSLKALRYFGFKVTYENYKQKVKTLRIIGGIEEYIRFFQTFNPAIKRKMTIKNKQVKKSFQIKDIIKLNNNREMYDIRTGTGNFIANGLISHNCYADFIRRFQNIPEKWGDFVYAKINCPELLKKELDKNKPGHIWMSSVTDCYCPIEGKYRLTRRILEIIADGSYKNKFTIEILTKSALVRRDFDLLMKLNCELGMSINTLDSKISRIIEPLASPPLERIKVLKEAKEKGIKVYGFISPVLPGITNLEELFKELSFCEYVWVELLNIKPSILARLMPIIKKNFPDKLKDFEFMINNYEEYISKVKREVKELSEKYNLKVRDVVVH